MSEAANIRNIPSWYELEELAEQAEQAEQLERTYSNGQNGQQEHWVEVLLAKCQRNGRRVWKRGKLKRRRNENGTYRYNRRTERGKGNYERPPKIIVEVLERSTPGAFGLAIPALLHELLQSCNGTYSIDEITKAYHAGARSTDAFRAVTLLQRHNGYDSLEEATQFLVRSLRKNGNGKISQKVCEEVSNISRLVMEFNIRFDDACFAYWQAKSKLKRTYNGYSEIPLDEAYARAKKFVCKMLKEKQPRPKIQSFGTLSDSQQETLGLVKPEIVNAVESIILEEIEGRSTLLQG